MRVYVCERGSVWARVCVRESVHACMRAFARVCA